MEEPTSALREAFDTAGENIAEICLERPPPFYSFVEWLLDDVVEEFNVRSLERCPEESRVGHIGRNFSNSAGGKSQEEVKERRAPALDLSKKRVDQ